MPARTNALSRSFDSRPPSFLSRLVPTVSILDPPRLFASLLVPSRALSCLFASLLCPLVPLVPTLSLDPSTRPPSSHLVPTVSILDPGSRSLQFSLPRIGGSKRCGRLNEHELVPNVRKLFVCRSSTPSQCSRLLPIWQAACVDAHERTHSILLMLHSLQRHSLPLPTPPPQLPPLAPPLPPERLPSPRSSLVPPVRRAASVRSASWPHAGAFLGSGG